MINCNCKHWNFDSALKQLVEKISIAFKNMPRMLKDDSIQAITMYGNSHHIKLMLQSLKEDQMLFSISKADLSEMELIMQQKVKCVGKGIKAAPMGKLHERSDGRPLMSLDTNK